MVHDPSRGTNNDMHATFQSTRLGTVFLSTVYRQHVKTLHLRGIGLEGLGHLDGQLTRWSQHQYLRIFLFQIEVG